MGMFSKIAKIDPVAKRVVKDTVKATGAVSKASGGKDVLAGAMNKDAKKVSSAIGASKPSVARGAVASPRPVAKPAPVAKPGMGSVVGAVASAKPMTSATVNARPKGFDSRGSR